MLEFRRLVRIDQAIEDAARGGIDREGDSVGGEGVGMGEPIGAQTDRGGVGLNLEAPADVIGGPAKGEEVRRNGVAVCNCHQI